MSERLKVVVERSKWLRGEGWEKSKLLRSTDGKMCCLGFACLAMGATEEQINNMNSPTMVCNMGGGLELPMLTMVDTDHLGRRLIHKDPVSEAMMINDERILSESAREARLTQLLAKVGIDLEFVD